MAYRTYDRNPSGIVFFGTSSSDQAFESNSNFTIGDNYLTASNLKVADNGKIGNASNTGIITLGSNGVATFSSGVTIQGDLIVNGTQTVLNVETITVDDNTIVLNNNVSGVAPSEDAGIEIRRGTSNNVGIIWNETSDIWTFTNDGVIYHEIASRTGVQTLLNKTISGNDNTITNIGNASLINSSVNVVAGTGLAGGGSVSLGSSVTVNFGAGNGLTASADSVAVTAGTGISVNGDGVHVDYDDSTIGIVGGKLAVKVSGVTDTQLNANIISNQPAITSVDGSADFLLIWDATDSLLKKVNRSNFVTGLGTMSSFNVTDGTTSVAVSESETVTFADGTGAEFVVTNVGGQPTVTVNSVDSEIVHDNLSGFVANEHIDHSTVSVTAGSGLVGGGDLTATRTFDIVGGDGITVGADEIEVTVDGSTIELSASDGTGAIRVKDGGITEAKISRSVASVSTAVTLSSDINLVTAGATNLTVTLPAPSTGKMVFVKKVDSGAGNVVVSKNSTDTIDGANTINLYYQYESLTFVSDGTNWFTV